MQDFKKLRVWQKSYKLTLEIYRISGPFQKNDRDLVRQARRAASSISNNIAEGSGRHTRKDQAHFFQIAYGSTNELENQLSLFRDLGYVEVSKIKDVLLNVVDLRKMLGSLIRYKRAERRSAEKTE